MAEEFVVGMAEVAEGRCLLLNVATDAVPRVDQTSLLVVTVSLLAPQGIYGMPGPDDKLDLEAFEGELKTSLVDACELVVKITGDSFRRFMFFAPVEIHDLDAVIKRLRSRHSGRTFELGSQSDVDHAIFATMLVGDGRTSARFKNWSEREQSFHNHDRSTSPWCCHR